MQRTRWIGLEMAGGQGRAAVLHRWRGPDARALFGPGGRLCHGGMS